MTTAIEARADGWQRDYSRASAAVQMLARECLQLRARVAELEAREARWLEAVGRMRDRLPDGAA
jgi:hypothetical protein